MCNKIKYNTINRRLSQFRSWRYKSCFSLQRFASTAIQQNKSFHFYRSGIRLYFSLLHVCESHKLVEAWQRCPWCWGGCHGDCAHEQWSVTSIKGGVTQLMTSRMRHLARHYRRHLSVSWKSSPVSPGQQYAAFFAPLSNFRVLRNRIPYGYWNGYPGTRLETTLRVQV